MAKPMLCISAGPSSIVLADPPHTGSDAHQQCAVCAEPPDNGVPLLACVCCGIGVHTECYLPPAACANATIPFRCQPCTATDMEPWSCKLCGHGGGAAVAAVDGGWVHGVCAMYSQASRFSPTLAV